MTEVIAGDLKPWLRLLLCPGPNKREKQEAMPAFISCRRLWEQREDLKRENWTQRQTEAREEEDPQKLASFCRRGDMIKGVKQHGSHEERLTDKV